MKFSGVLLAPSYAAQRLLTPGPRVRGFALAIAASLLAFALLSPYTLLHLPAFWDGVRSQVGYHYVVRPRGEQAYLGMVGTYLGVLAKGLGGAALGLVLVGAVNVRQEWRRFAPLALFPLVFIAVFSTAEVNRDRFVLPALGVLAVFAGAGVAWIAGHSRALAAAVALLAAGGPLVQSVRYVIAIGRPGTRDQALDWLGANAPEGARILTTLPELGRDRARYEVVALDAFDERAALLAPSMDYVITRAAEPDLAVVRALAPRDANAGPAVVIARPEQPRALRTVPLQPGSLSASENAETLAAVLDGDLATRWQSAAPQAPGTWVEVHLPEPRVLGRLELELGDRPRQFPANLHVFAREESGEWTRLRTIDGRPPLAEQRGQPSLVMLFAPVRTSALRLEQVGRRLRPWSIAELRVQEQVP
jgi:F5/8 type C domain-containing protein